MLLAATPEFTLTIFPLVSFLFLLLVFLSLWLLHSLELRLIVLGLLTAVLAVWCGFLPGGEGVVVQPPRGSEVGWALRGGAADPLGKIAVLLVLGGLAVSILGRSNSPRPPVKPEETAHEKTV